MSRREVLCTRVGEMREMITCEAIMNGARPKAPHKELSFLETLEVI